MFRQDTETLDRLYLEWSQFTHARTRRETKLQCELESIYALVSTMRNQGETHREAVNRILQEAVQNASR